MTIKEKLKRKSGPARPERGPGTGSVIEGKRLKQNKEPIQIRVDPELLGRIDRAAQRLGISRSAFIVSSTAIRLENME